MSYTVIFTPESEAQLTELYRYIAAASSPEVAAEAAEIGRLRASLAGSKSENGPTYAARTRSWQVLCFTKVLKCYPKVIKVGG
jgi:plasmid stabilization system protein ParE